MRNPFATRKKKVQPQVHSGIILNNNTISGSINSIPGSLTTISTGSYSYGAQGVTGASGWGYASAATFTYMDPEEVMKRRKAELMKEYEENPELFSEIIVELRKEKIRQLREKSQPQTQ